MSVVDNAFNNDDTFVQRFLRRAAHWMLYAVAARAILLIPNYFNIGHWILTVGRALTMTLVIVGLLHNHLTHLCARCMEEVPLDASDTAEKQWWVLRTNHLLDSWRRVLTYMAVTSGLDVVVIGLHLPHLAYLPADAFFVTYLYSIWLHHRLRPWCPYCRRWDSSGGIDEPSPAPVGKAIR